MFESIVDSFDIKNICTTFTVETEKIQSRKFIFFKEVDFDGGKRFHICIHCTKFYKNY